MPSTGRPPGRAPISPRVRLAARLYQSGAVASKREASEAAGLHPSYFSLVSSPNHHLYNPEVTELMDEIDRQIQDKTVDMSAVLQTLGREALSRMRQVMKESKNEAIVVKAAADILDRSPETSKIQKHQVASFSVSGDDAKLLAAAMVRSAQAREQFAEVASGDFVRVPLGQPQENTDNAGQGLLSPTMGQVDEGDLSDSGSLDGQGTGAVPAKQGSAEGRSASEESASEGPLTNDKAMQVLKDERRLRLIKGADNA